MPTKKNTKDPYKVATGHLLRLWREKHGWSQSVLHALADAYELPFYGSQVSHFENGRVEPKSEWFVALGKMMKIIDEGKFSKIKDRKLKDQLIGSEAIFHSDGKIYSGSYWFACFVGEINPPEEYTLMNDEKAKEISDLCRNAFEKKWKSEKDKRTAKRNTWDNIFNALDEKDWAKKLKGKIGDVLNDLDDFNGDEARSMQDKKGGNNLLVIIEEVPATELPENYERLQKAMRNI